MKRIIFMGTPQFAVEVLAGLIESKAYDIVGVVTQPDRRVGRKRQVQPTPVKELALEHGLTIYQPEHLPSSEELDELISLEADLIVTAAYGQFLPKSLLNSVKIAPINVHASLLPKYRGGAPIHYAIWKGESETGVTIMEMVQQMDAGDMYAQRAIPITADDDSGIMFDKLAILGRDLLLETLPQIIDGSIEPTPQDEELATYSPNITRAQEQIDWTQTAQAIDQQVRAFRPFPSSYTLLDGERVKIWAGYPVNEMQSDLPAGHVVGIVDEALVVSCGDNTCYAVTRWQESGKRAMDISDYLNGIADDSEVKEYVFEWNADKE